MKKFIAVVTVMLSLAGAVAEDAASQSAQTVNGVSGDERNAQAEILLNRTNELLQRGDYFKAAATINDVMDLYGNAAVGLPDNVLLMSEAVYYKLFEKINNEKNLHDFPRAVDLIKWYPGIASERIRNTISQTYEYERAQIAERRDAASLQQNNREWIRQNRLYEQSVQQQTDLFDVLDGKVSVAEIRLQRQNALLAEQARTRQVLVYLLSAVVALLAVIVCSMLFYGVQHKREDGRHFETMMNVVSLLNRDAEEKYIRQGELPNYKDYEAAVKAVDFADSKEGRKKLAKLKHHCEMLGSKIDSITARQNNSRKVSDRVYEMSRRMDAEPHLAEVYSCAAMVYDAGFLSIDSDTLHAEHLTVKQRYEIRSHVQKADPYLKFVPEQLMPIFENAAAFHHENINGTGYIEGLTTEKIPEIARMIHTVESYTSLVNKRVYREGMDSNSAIAEMKSKPGVYDEKMIEVLQEIV